MSELPLCECGCGGHVTSPKNRFIRGHHMRVPEIIEKGWETRRNSPKIKRDKPEKCDYGCGRKAKYYFPTPNKWCCESHWMKCPEGKKRHPPAWNKGKTGVYSEEALKQMSESSKGHIPWHKGKTGVYSEEQLKKMSECAKRENLSPETLKKMSDAKKGQTPWNKGITGFISEEGLKSKSEKMKGRTPWNKGKKGYLSEEALKNISESGKGRIPWNKGKKGLKAWNKGKKGIYSKETLKALSKNCRLATIKRIQNNLENGNQLYPNYNPTGCKLIDEYGNQYGFDFQHAENGGEFFLSKLGYWVDGYDKDKNVVIEVDEYHHFDASGNLSEKDLQRQTEIIEELGCTFIRIKLDKDSNIVNVISM